MPVRKEKRRAQGKYEGSMQTMNNGKSNMMKRMAIAAVCVGMVGSGGLVQAMNTAKSDAQPLKTGKITPVMTQMINVPASKIASLPLWEDNKITRVNLPDFQIGKAEVTGALWSEVYNWAIKKGYKFASEGANVGTGKPVTEVSWYDVIVWLNAYSEKSGLEPVYQSGGVFLGISKKVLKDATDRTALDKAVLIKKNDKRGYQLPTVEQRELAARWNGIKKPTKGTLASEVIATKGKDNKTTYYWTPANYASGATEYWGYRKETLRVAWFHEKNMQTVCTKATNVLKICDMSGNAQEWVYDSTSSKEERYVMGGDRHKVDYYLFLGSNYDYYVHTTQPPYDEVKHIGFRLVRNLR